MWDDDAMPVDGDGNRADFIMDGDSTVKRMNIGRMYEHYVNATSTHIQKQIRDRVETEGWSEQLVNECFAKILRYYEILSPTMHELMASGKASSPKEHVESIVKDGFYLYLPTDNPVRYKDAVKTLSQEFPLNLGPVQYRGRSGNTVTTKNSVLIGSMYIMLLEKIANDWSGVSSAKLQHFGIPAKLTNADKNSAPGRAQPVRMFGESEIRLTSAFAGPTIVSDIADQSNNPAVHKEVVKNIYKADKPTNIERIVDRAKFPIGNGRPLVYLRHMFECSGVRIVTPPKEKFQADV